MHQCGGDAGPNNLVGAWGMTRAVFHKPLRQTKGLLQ
jgi:hypothetical protein